VPVQGRREKARCSSGCKSRPGKGRPGRVAIPAAAEATKPSNVLVKEDVAWQEARGHVRGQGRWRRAARLRDSACNRAFGMHNCTA